MTAAPEPPEGRELDRELLLTQTDEEAFKRAVRMVQDWDEKQTAWARRPLTLAALKAAAGEGRGEG